MEDLANRRRLLLADGPLEMLPQLLAHRHEDDARPELRDAEVGRVEQPEVGLVALLLKRALEAAAEVLEDRVEDATHVLDHHGARLAFVDDPERLREQVAFV